MFLTFILGIVAGFGVSHAEGKVKELLDGVLSTDAPLEGAELRLVTFSLLVLLAALIAAILTTAYAVPLAFGAVIGVISPRVLERYRGARYPDYDS